MSGIVFEHAIRRIRRLRQEGESDDTIQALLGRMETNLGLDPKAVMDGSKQPGAINGYPFMMADQIKSGAS